MVDAIMRTRTGRCFPGCPTAYRLFSYKLVRLRSESSRKYAIPNDEAEQDRLDTIHHIYLLMLDDQLHLAPIAPNPTMILDVGTGTGIWAIDAAE